MNNYENIKHDAEQSTRKWNNIYLVLCMLLFIFCGILGIIIGSRQIGPGINLIIVSIFGITFTLLFNSLVDTLTNISVKLDKLENMQRTLKKMEANQDRLTKHLDV